MKDRKDSHLENLQDLSKNQFEEIIKIMKDLYDKLSNNSKIDVVGINILFNQISKSQLCIHGHLEIMIADIDKLDVGCELKDEQPYDILTNILNTQIKDEKGVYKEKQGVRIDLNQVDNMRALEILHIYETKMKQIIKHARRLQTGEINRQNYIDNLLFNRISPAPVCYVYLTYYRDKLFLSIVPEIILEPIDYAIELKNERDLYSLKINQYAKEDKYRVMKQITPLVRPSIKVSTEGIYTKNVNELKSEIKEAIEHEDRFIIRSIPEEIIRHAKESKENVSQTAFSINRGNSLGQLYFKKLNITKIKKRYKGNYIQLWKNNYEILSNLIPLNDFYGIIETEDGEIFEFSKIINEGKLLCNGRIHSWSTVKEIFNKVLIYINKVEEYKKMTGRIIGFDTSIWNFTTDFKLFDLDPPRLLDNIEDKSFMDPDDINHCKRTFYRNFNEIGMKANLLATVIIGLQDGNFKIKDLPNNWLKYLINSLCNSINNQKEKENILRIFNGFIEFIPDFSKHPIDIILREINKQNIGEKIMKTVSENKNQQFIFVTGPSESGKSGGIIHIEKKYPDNVKHLKIRDIFPEVYRDSNSSLTYNEWYENESTYNFENFWDRYIEKARKMSEGADIVLMDTMYGVKEIQHLYKRLGKYLGVLYIDASEEKRIQREYQRLRTDSPYSNRKADLSVTIEQVTERTRKKDEKKKKLGTFEYKDLAYEQDGTIVVRPNGIRFSKIIENNGTLQELYDKLDSYIDQEIKKVKNRKELTQEER